VFTVVTFPRSDFTGIEFLKPFCTFQINTASFQGSNECKNQWESGTRKERKKEGRTEHLQ